MLQRSVIVRVIAPTAFVSLLLLVSCTAVAVYLYRQQYATAEIYGENVGSRKAADDLLRDLNALHLVLRAATRDPEARNEQVDTFNASIRKSLENATKFADKEGERILITQLEYSCARYSRELKAGLNVPETAPSVPVLATIQTLESDTLPLAGQLLAFNTRETEESEAKHRLTLQWMAWGLAIVGSIGSLAGIFVGYGVARSLRQSIYQLSVRVRDAAGKLRQELPTVLLSEDDDLHHLQQQMQGMVHEIEQVVGKLQQREREILRADQMAAVGQIAAGVAHELRNPLTSIKLLVQKNQRQAGAHGLPTENLGIIEQEIRRMERCLQTFLDFARPPKPERRQTDISTLVNRTLTLLEGRARNQQVTLRFRQPETSTIVEVDCDQVQQLLLNLGLNALDAMPRGGSLRVELDTSMNGQVELIVSDTGPGISAEVLPRLFEPFVSGKETGLGLGLVISRRIAEDHGGSVSAYNRPEGGACFVFRLPVLAASVRV